MLENEAVDIDQLSVLLGKQLNLIGWTVGVAESCTGGLLGHTITNTPGSSDYFKGGIIAYANEVKQRLLNVDQAILEQHGAVSRETALSMAIGAQKILEVNLAAAITGIAGPDGGTDEKPVGTVWIAVADPQGAEARRFLFEGDRRSIKRQSARSAMGMLLEALEEPS